MNTLKVVQLDVRWVGLTVVASIAATTLQGLAVALVRSSDAASLPVVLGALTASFVMDFGTRASGAQLLHASGSRTARRLLADLDHILVEAELTDDPRVARATRLLSAASVSVARFSQSLLVGVLGAIRAFVVLASALGPVGPASILRASAVLASVALLAAVRLRGVARIQARQHRSQGRGTRSTDAGVVLPMKALPRVVAATGSIRERLLLQHRSAAETRLMVLAIVALQALVSGGGSSSDVGAAVAGALIAANAFSGAARTAVGLGRFLPTMRAAGRFMAEARGGEVAAALAFAELARDVDESDDE